MQSRRSLRLLQLRWRQPLPLLHRFQCQQPQGQGLIAHALQVLERFEFTVYAY